MKKILSTLLAGSMLLSGAVAFAAETDVSAVLAEYGLTGEDVLAIANVYKQVNEGNAPHLEGFTWYETEFKLAKIAADRAESGNRSGMVSGCRGPRLRRSRRRSEPPRRSEIIFFSHSFQQEIRLTTVG